MKKRVLIFIDWFDPAYKAGGPIRSVVNMVQWQEEELDLWIFTSAYDLHSSEELKGPVLNRWTSYGNHAHVFYATRDQLKYSSIKRIIRSVAPDQLYLNGMFSIKFVLFPLWMQRWSNKPIPTLLVPRGMLKSSALAFKRTKKIIFLKLSQLLGLYNKVSFQATDKQELEDVKSRFPQHDVELKPNFPSKIARSTLSLEKKPGFLQLIFVGRIHPIKNLQFLLETLKPILGEVILTICGVSENKEYLKICQHTASTLPANITVNFVGEREHASLLKLMEEHHALALPTQGENFGHAIFEMLSLGRPVIISDQTPWKNLEEKKMGFDLPLDKPVLFSQAIQTMVDWGQVEWDGFSSEARNPLAH